jgi:hypothetical protein
VGDSVDQLEPSGGRIGGVEAKQRDHSVNVDQQQRLGGVIWHLSG